ncbi:hypothetical protein GGR01_003345 [Acetobacter oeni]|nr:hypothetical protein [Acetobacter oeni]
MPRSGAWMKVIACRYAKHATALGQAAASDENVRHFRNIVVFLPSRRGIGGLEVGA